MSEYKEINNYLQVREELKINGKESKLQQLVPANKETKISVEQKQKAASHCTIL